MMSPCHPCGHSNLPTTKTCQKPTGSFGGNLGGTTSLEPLEITIIFWGASIRYALHFFFLITLEDDSFNWSKLHSKKEMIKKIVKKDCYWVTN